MEMIENDIGKKKMTLKHVDQKIDPKNPSKKGI